MREPTRLKLAPSILTADFGHLADQIQAAEAGGADYIHLDVMDGRFVPNISFGPMVVRAVRALTTLPLDVHLMIEDADPYLRDFIDAGANILT
ncbi:MAG: ribulose-phosphate 3-epimerase, partial [Caldilineaceae bacterium]|nr:ribulose-phosphate 3-epimerase [Caldilineaceae bacterium]